MQRTTMGSTGSGVEYAGLIPGTRLGNFIDKSVSSPIPPPNPVVAILPRRVPLPTVPCPTVEKLGLNDRLVRRRE